jgi:hypothetical protein
VIMNPNCSDLRQPRYSAAAGRDSACTAATRGAGGNLGISKITAIGTGFAMLLLHERVPARRAGTDENTDRRSIMVQKHSNRRNQDA